jgi:hypothetical protein
MDKLPVSEETGYFSGDINNEITIKQLQRIGKYLIIPQKYIYFPDFLKFALIRL